MFKRAPDLLRSRLQSAVGLSCCFTGGSDVKTRINMTYRTLPVVLVLLALVCFVGQAAIAADKDANTHEGKVVKAGNGTLTMTDLKGNEMTHKVAPTAKITCDGKECKLEDLKAGYRIKVTEGTDADKSLSKIEANSK